MSEEMSDKEKKERASRIFEGLDYDENCRKELFDMFFEIIGETTDKKEPSSSDLVSHTFMVSGEDLAALKAYAKREGVSLNAAARMAIKRLLRNY